MSDTLKYYAEHADEFIENTLTVDMSEFYRRFEKYLEPGDTVLDLGFGSGRDSRYFLNQGYVVTSVDGSPEMCEAAKEFLPCVRCCLFSDLDYMESFDAVWACASLLHVPKNEMQDVLQKVVRSLKDGGIFYVSYKYGTEERNKDGREFSDYTEESFGELLKDFPELQVLEIWVTDDVRPEKTEKWLNAILKKENKKEKHYTERELLNIKLDIMKKFVESNYDIEVLKEEQLKHPEVLTKYPELKMKQPEKKEIEEAIQSRHSVRKYTTKPIAPELAERLYSETVACNKESGLNIQLIVNEPKCFDNIKAYGAFKNANNYFALVGDGKREYLYECCGYYGERLVLLAETLGLRTCWVAGSFGRKACQATTQTGEKLVCVISVGYAEKEGKPHNSKPISKVCDVKPEDMPDWFRKGVEAALLAPTAINQQQFMISLEDGEPVIRAKLGPYSKIDLGIVKYHFEVASGRKCK